LGLLVQLVLLPFLLALHAVLFPRVRLEVLASVARPCVPELIESAHSPCSGHSKVIETYEIPALARHVRNRGIRRSKSENRPAPLSLVGVGWRRPSPFASRLSQG